MLSAHPNTIVVNQSGTPVAMPWVDSANTLVQAFYGGNELGNGLVRIQFYFIFTFLRNEANFVFTLGRCSIRQGQPVREACAYLP
jgi:hypothetical protein